MASSSSSSLENSRFSLLNPLKLPKISKFKIGLCQLSVTPDKNMNLTNANKMIKIAAEKGAKLIVLPEMWNCPYSNEYFATYAEDLSDENASQTFSMLSKVASCQGITIVGGSVPEWSNRVLYNTCCVFGPDGKLIAKQRKMHLFDIDIPGEISFKESDTFRAGDTPTIVDTDVGRIGIGICHDMRFPELAMLYRARGAHLICYPGAFNMSTGELLWELVQRARQIYAFFLVMKTLIFFCLVTDITWGPYATAFSQLRIPPCLSFDRIRTLYLSHFEKGKNVSVSQSSLTTTIILMYKNK